MNRKNDYNALTIVILAFAVLVVYIMWLGWNFS